MEVYVQRGSLPTKTNASGRDDSPGAPSEVPSPKLLGCILRQEVQPGAPTVLQLPGLRPCVELLQDRRSVRRVQREASLLTAYRGTENRTEPDCTMSELRRETSCLVQGLPRDTEEAPPSVFRSNRHLAPKEPGRLPSSSYLTPSPSPKKGVADTATETDNSLPPQQEDTYTQTYRRKKGRACQIAPPSTEETPSTTTKDAETRAPHPSTFGNELSSSHGTKCTRRPSLSRGKNSSTTPTPRASYGGSPT